eukprot:CCRYP_011322-RA/>CCRYP_011322-RA protein AED:0.46 eAED:0.46 QI:0/-1/0/1/-1/1/1/0/135
MAEALKYYITNSPKSPTGFRFVQFLSELNSSTATSRHCPCLYYKARRLIRRPRRVLPLDGRTWELIYSRLSSQVANQYDLTENTTPVSTRALLLVLENIENNRNFDNKPCPDQGKGADLKRKMESMDSASKKPKR